MRHPAALTIVALASVALSALTAAGLRQNPQPPAPQPAFRTGVDLVQVDVSVLDDDRRPVRGLTQADFTVLEDGKPRPLVAFTPVDLPGPAVALRQGNVPRARPWTETVAPDVSSNNVPRDGRLVVLLLDQSIKIPQQATARRIAAAAIDALAPGDLAAVLHTVRGTPQGFTADRARLMRAVNLPFTGASEADATLAANPENPTLPLSQSTNTATQGRGECPCGLCSMEAITRIAETLNDVPRRKTLLFLGTNVAIPSDDRDCPETRTVRQKMFRALDVANLTVQTVDPGGLETLAPTAEARRAPTPAQRTAQMSDHLKRQGNLAALAEHTGGRSITNANAPETFIPDIFRESSAYYSLAFAPAAPSTDGRFHQIAVRVDRRDVTVHARKGYYAGGSPTATGGVQLKGPPQNLADAVRGMWPKVDLPVSVAVAAFAAPGQPRPIVTLVVGTHRESAREDVASLAVAFNRDGRSANYHYQSLSIASNVPGAELDADLLSPLPLDPGRYEVRVAVGARGRTGSVTTYVDVPDFAKAPLALSGIVLHAAPGPLAAPETQFRRLIPVVPTARRRFQQSDTVEAFVRIYQGGSGQASGITVVGRIVDANGRQVFEERTTADPAASADYRVTLPLARLAPGPHLLTIAVTAKGRTETRDVRFEMR